MVDFNDLESLEQNGFNGFVKIEHLIQSPSLIPKIKGIYLILFTAKTIPEFLLVGTGGHFKNKNPNVSIQTLQEDWVDDTKVVYIGKAGGTNSSATLQSRLKQYLKFGQGKPIGHWGGRYIWQIKECMNLLVCWKTLPDDEPRQIESELLEYFISIYGNRPFANLTG